MRRQRLHSESDYSAKVFTCGAVAIYFEKDALIQKSQAFSVFTPEDVGFSGAF